MLGAMSASLSVLACFYLCLQGDDYLLTGPSESKLESKPKEPNQVSTQSKV